jgi:hypothetical protein
MLMYCTFNYMKFLKNFFSNFQTNWNLTYPKWLIDLQTEYLLFILMEDDTHWMNEPRKKLLSWKTKFHSNEIRSIDVLHQMHYFTMLTDFSSCHFWHRTLASKKSRIDPWSLNGHIIKSNFEQTRFGSFLHFFIDLELPKLNKKLSQFNKTFYIDIYIYIYVYVYPLF